MLGERLLGGNGYWLGTPTMGRLPEPNHTRSYGRRGRSQRRGGETIWTCIGSGAVPSVLVLGVHQSDVMWSTMTTWTCITHCMGRTKKWWATRDSNPRPFGCEPNALTG